jgi:hypothetical protein
MIQSTIKNFGFCVLLASVAACTGTVGSTTTQGTKEQSTNDEPNKLATGLPNTPPASSPSWQGVSCKADKPGPRLLRRLTGTQYDNTVADLLGVSSKLGASFVAAATVEGFSNNARALQIDPLMAEQLDAAASSLAAEGIKRIDALNAGCTATTQACAEVFIAKFGKRAYRRPLSSVEVQRLILVYKTERDAGESHAVGLETVLSAMLQSPGFLYRSERGTVQGSLATLDNFEIASELSYLLTDSMRSRQACVCH